MPPAELFGRLVAYYRACVEEEDRRALQLPVRSLDKTFVAPWYDGEPLLSSSNDTCVVDLSRPSTRDFLARGHATAGGTTAFYAYPLFLDEHGFLTPLFFVEVEVLEGGKQAGTLLRTKGAISVNHHLFRRTGYSKDELQALQDDLEGDFGTFAARLEAARDYLGSFADGMTKHGGEPFDPRVPGPRWIGTPVLFRSAYGAYTYHLRKDLDALIKYDFLRRDAAGTAFAALGGCGIRSTDSEPASNQDLAELLPLNEAQETATRAALHHPLTVVTGPPGTGKSQVVVDLLATAVLSGDAVLFASKNAKAVDVVRERIRGLLGDDLDFTLRLGNRIQMEQMPAELQDRLDALETAGPPDLDEAEAHISALRSELITLRAAHEQLVQARAREQDAADAVPCAWRTATGEQGTWPYPLRALREHLDQARALAGETRLGIVLWAKRLFMGSVLRRRLAEALEDALATAPEPIWVDVQTDVFASDGFDPLVRAFRGLMAYHAWIRTRDARQDAHRALSRLLHRADTFDQEVRVLKDELAAAYRTACRATWGRRIYARLPDVRRAARKYFEAADAMKTFRGSYRDKLDAFQAAQRELAALLPVWIVTNLSTRNALPLRAGLFDLVVIDEASQCDVASALPLLFRGKRAVIIGDPKQLRHISALKESDERRIASHLSVEDLLARWSYRDRSLYDVAAEAARLGGQAPHFLDEHYRSHPSIIGFSNAEFYGGRLLVRTDVQGLEQRLTSFPLGLFWHVVIGRVPPAAGSAYNPDEAKELLQLLGEHVTLGPLAAPTVRIGIATPFRAQRELILHRLVHAPWYDQVRDRIVVDTAHGFQGDECDVLYFSPVVAEGLRAGSARWVAETDQLLNVAITRARAALHIVGDPTACRRAGGTLARLVAYATSASRADPVQAAPRPRV